MWNFPRMRLTVLFVLTLSGLCRANYRAYHYIRSLQTWTEAQTYCRFLYSDLATVENPDDNKAKSNLQELPNFVWIGYYDDLRKWKWALGNADFDNDVDFDSWSISEPSDQRSGDRCAVITQRGYWHDISCDNLRFAVCFNEQGLHTYVFVQTVMTWYQSRQYCKSYYTDLVSVSSFEENYDISSLVLGDAWIGLHRQPWAWSDASTSNFTNWGGVETSDIVGMTSCTTASITTGLWWQADCDEEHPFICEELSSQGSASIVQNEATITITATTTTTTYRLKFKSEEDPNDPAVQQQILKQLRAKLKKHRLPEFTLHWIQTDGQTFNKVQEERESPSVCSQRSDSLRPRRGLDKKIL